MRFPQDLIEARISRRLSRFVMEVDLNGRTLPVHLANSGRVAELMTPGAPALLRPCLDTSRRLTAYDLVLVQAGVGWVSADARLANALVKEALERGRIEALGAYPEVKAEARNSHSRIDFILAGPSESCLLEVKSVTLVQDRIALFPDAPTRRGVRHLQTLIASLEAGGAAAVLFVVQREDAIAVRPCDAVDPVFGRTLRAASDAGVLLLAHRCHVTPCSIELADEIPVRLS